MLYIDLGYTGRQPRIVLIEKAVEFSIFPPFLSSLVTMCYIFYLNAICIAFTNTPSDNIIIYLDSFQLLHYIIVKYLHIEIILKYMLHYLIACTKISPCRIV